MEINEKYKSFLTILNNKELVSDDLLEKLLENVCTTLSDQKVANEASVLPQGGSVKLKQLHASLLYVFTQYSRYSQSSEDLSNFLITECDVENSRANVLKAFYEKWFQLIRIRLLNIGSHLPHITDVRWKIDYIVKSNSLDQPEGPVFRVSLKTEKYDKSLQGPKLDFINFTCTSQELQDLVYKLKDAVRHCQKLAEGH